MKVNSFVKAAVLALGAALIVMSCGGSKDNGGAGTPAATVISTSDQGAQAAAIGIVLGQAAANIGVKLSSLTNVAATTLAVVPALTLVPMTLDCTTRSAAASGSPNTITVGTDAVTGLVTATLNACTVGGTSVTGGMTLDTSGDFRLTLGSGTVPLVVTDFAGAGSATVISTTDVLATVVFSQSGMINMMTVTGSVESRDYVRHTRDRYDLNGLSVTVAKSAAVIGPDNYDVATVTLNGGLARTVYLSDTDPLVGATETGTLTNLVVVLKTPAAGSAAVARYLGIDGAFAVTTTPAMCIDGNFVIATTADLQTDAATGGVTAGQVTINSNVVATYNADNSLSVAVDGGAPTIYTAAALATLCPI